MFRIAISLLVIIMVKSMWESNKQLGCILKTSLYKEFLDKVDEKGIFRRNKCFQEMLEEFNEQIGIQGVLSFVREFSANVVMCMVFPFLCLSVGFTQMQIMTGYAFLVTCLTVLSSVIQKRTRGISVGIIRGDINELNVLATWNKALVVLKLARYRGSFVRDYYDILAKTACSSRDYYESQGIEVTFVDENISNDDKVSK